LSCASSWDESSGTPPKYARPPSEAARDRKIYVFVLLPSSPLLPRYFCGASLVVALSDGACRRVIRGGGGRYAVRSREVRRLALLLGRSRSGRMCSPRCCSHLRLRPLEVRSGLRKTVCVEHGCPGKHRRRLSDLNLGCNPTDSSYRIRTFSGFRLRFYLVLLRGLRILSLGCIHDSFEAFSFSSVIIARKAVHTHRRPVIFTFTGSPMSYRNFVRVRKHGIIPTILVPNVVRFWLPTLCVDVFRLWLIEFR